MRRREFLASFAAVTFVTKRTMAEPSRPWRVAFLGSGTSSERTVPIFLNALQKLGYQQGKNLILDIREAKGDYKLLPDLIKEIIALAPDVIVAEATPAIAAAKNATDKIPIIMAPATDPIGSGFVQSFPHPGGNITGVANMFGDLIAKTLEFLHLVLPRVRKVGVLTSDNPTHLQLFEVAKLSAQTIGISAERFIAETPSDEEAAFKAMKSSGCEAVYVLADPARPVIPELASKFGLPAIYQVDRYMSMGGLMSYGPDIAAMFVKTASYVDRILKGSAPAELPVEQPTHFRFIVNLRTARALRITIPDSVLALADEVIE